MVSLLRSRAVVRFRGPETVKFLHGLLTNDVRRFGELGGEKRESSTPGTPDGPAPPMYAALLTPQGRFLYDMFVYRSPQFDGPGSDPDGSFELLMDVDSSELEEVLKTFKK